MALELGLCEESPCGYTWILIVPSVLGTKETSLLALVADRSSPAKIVITMLLGQVGLQRNIRTLRYFRTMVSQPL